MDNLNFYPEAIIEFLSQQLPWMVCNERKLAGYIFLIDDDISHPVRLDYCFDDMEIFFGDLHPGQWKEALKLIEDDAGAEYLKARGHFDE